MSNSLSPHGGILSVHVADFLRSMTAGADHAKFPQMQGDYGVGSQAYITAETGYDGYGNPNFRSPLARLSRVHASRLVQGCRLSLVHGPDFFQSMRDGHSSSITSETGERRRLPNSRRNRECSETAIESG